jgi:hypothetical protein
MFCLTLGFGQETQSNDQLKKAFYKTLTTYPDSSQLILKQFKDRNTGNSNVADEIALMEGTLMYYVQGGSDAKKKIEKALKLAQTDKSTYYDALKMMGFILRDEGNTKKSLAVLQQCLNYQKKVNNKKQIAGIQNAIGLTLLASKNESQAIPYFREAFTYYKKSSNLSAIKSGMALSTTLNATGQFSEGKIILKEVYALSKKLGDELVEADCLSEMGALEFDLKNYSGAEKFFLQALPIYEKYQLNEPLAVTYLRLYNVNAEQNKMVAAKPYLDNAKIYIYANQQQDLITNYKWHLYDYFYRTGDYKKALEYFEAFTNENDSIYGLENSKAINELNIQYQSAEKDKKIAQNKLSILQKNKELEQKNRIVWSVGILLVLVGLVTWFALRTARKQKQLNKQLAEINRFDDLLYRIIGHDLKSMIASNAYDSPVEVRQRTTQQTINVLEGLLEWRKQNNKSVINLARLLDQLEDENDLSLKHKNLDLEVSGNSWPNLSGSEKAMETILRNLISNAITYSPSNATVTIKVDSSKLFISNLYEPVARHGTQIGHTIVQALCDKYAIGFLFEKSNGKAAVTLTF